MPWSQYVMTVVYDDLFNGHFEEFMVFHSMKCRASVRDEFSMLMMGGEL